MSVASYCRLILILTLFVMHACCAIAKRRVYSFIQTVTEEYLEENKHRLSKEMQASIRLDTDLKETEINMVIGAVRFTYSLFTTTIMLLSLFI